MKQWVRREANTEQRIERAKDDRILQYRWLANDLLSKVFDVRDAWVSDESSLWDFHDEESNELYYEKIVERYGVDVREIEGANLVGVLEKIDGEAKLRFWLMEEPSDPLAAK